MAMTDYSEFILAGAREPDRRWTRCGPDAGQVAKLRDGDFDESLLEANINNYKLYQLCQLEKATAHADWFVQSFINGSNWADEVTALDRMAKLTKQDCGLC